VLRGKGQAKKGRGLLVAEIERGDFDGDGSEEVMLNSELLNVFVDPAEGGRITELDWKPRVLQSHDTLTRRREG